MAANPPDARQFADMLWLRSDAWWNDRKVIEAALHAYGAALLRHAAETLWHAEGVEPYNGHAGKRQKDRLFALEYLRKLADTEADTR